MTSASSPPHQASPVVVLLDGLEAGTDLDVVRDRVGEFFGCGASMSARGLLELAASAFLACGTSCSATTANASTATPRLGSCAAAGINKQIGPHTLRHGFITAALDAGVPLRDVQEAASHADPRTTMRYDRAGARSPVTPPASCRHSSPAPPADQRTAHNTRAEPLAHSAHTEHCAPVVGLGERQAAKLRAAQGRGYKWAKPGRLDTLHKDQWVGLPAAGEAIVAGDRRLGMLIQAGRLRPALSETGEAGVAAVMSVAGVSSTSSSARRCHRLDGGSWPRR